MSQSYWKIEGFDSTEKIFERKIKVGIFSERQIQSLLMALAAKAGLGCDEIVGAYARRRTKVANNLLEVQKGGLCPVYSCGGNPHFSAKVVGEHDL